MFISCRKARLLLFALATVLLAAPSAKAIKTKDSGSAMPAAPERTAVRAGAELASLRYCAGSNDREYHVVRATFNLKLTNLESSPIRFTLSKNAITGSRVGKTPEDIQRGHFEEVFEPDLFLSDKESERRLAISLGPGETRKIAAITTVVVRVAGKMPGRAVVSPGRHFIQLEIAAEDVRLADQKLANRTLVTRPIPLALPDHPAIRACR